ncbi:hypothetical protein CDCA_CDCA07G2029 [Cyanidium caldarium]|uniref:Zinc transporter n=1 Tax=Cyanidium caldarium TaxID=2771 RepID=A0AAV9IUR4_CYACA|nr:hypothetical protein CDCA_CDCA07G2029 [Cyanidium caldarium]
MSRVATAFLLSTVAGLSTGLGSLWVYLVHRQWDTGAPAGSHSMCRAADAAEAVPVSALGLWQGGTAGLMMGLCLFDLLPEVLQSVPRRLSWPAAVLSFSAGALLFALLQRLVPEPGTLWERAADDASRGFARRANSPKSVLDSCRRATATTTTATTTTVTNTRRRNAEAQRSALLIGISLALHNLPEGMAVGAAALRGGLQLGLPLAIGIALHNIPEGCAVAAPVYAATGSWRTAFGWSLASGLVEPLGVLVVVTVWTPRSEAALAALVSGVAGVMMSLSLAELLPESARNCEHGWRGALAATLAGVVAMAVMIGAVRGVLAYAL